MNLLLAILWQRWISIPMQNFQKSWHTCNFQFIAVFIRRWINFFTVLVSCIERIKWITKVFFGKNMQKSDHVHIRIGEMLGLEMDRSYVAGDWGLDKGENNNFASCVCLVKIIQWQELPSYVDYEVRDTFYISLNSTHKFSLDSQGRSQNESIYYWG